MVERCGRDRREVSGFPIELVTSDDGCSAEDGQRTAAKIVSDDAIMAVIGHD